MGVDDGGNSIEIGTSNPIPTVEQVLRRDVVRFSSYKFASALLAQDSPLSPMIPAIREKHGRGNLSDEITDPQATQVLDILTKVTGQSEDAFKTKHADSREILDDPETQAYYVKQLEQVIDIFQEQGILPPPLKDLITSRLLIPSQLQLVTGDISDFTLRSVLLPKEPLTLRMSPKHIEHAISVVQSYLQRAGLTDRFTDEEIKDLGTQTALAHEFGHAMDTGLAILLAANTLDSQPPYQKLDTRKLDDESDTKVWDAVSNKKNGLFEIANDNRMERLIPYFRKEDIVTTFMEGVPVGAELALIDAVVRKKGWSDQDRSRLFDAIKGYFSEAQDEYVDFTKLVSDQGLIKPVSGWDATNRYYSFKNTVDGALRPRGYYIGNLLPSAPDCKMIGYTYPLFPDAFKKYVTTFSDPSR